ncbi:unnamed protein product, partial [Mesorhabditis spiculigera]
MAAVDGAIGTSQKQLDLDVKTALEVTVVEATPVTADEAETDTSFLNSLIQRIMSAGLKQEPEAYIPVRRLTRLAVESFKSEPMLLRIPATEGPVHIFGDLHGQLRDLRMMINHIGMPGADGTGAHYLFLGDYVDRGLQGAETFLLLAAMRCRYPKSVFLLRGNHEDLNTAITYGLYDEVMERYGEQHGEYVWLHLISMFNWMPIAALIGTKVLAMHGGLSPNLASLEQINQIARPTLIPPYGLMCDLVWADPDALADPRASWAMSSRGISFSFDERAVISFCHRTKVDLIVRAHQINTEMLQHGHKWFGQTGRLVTLFSAPNYLNMANSGGVLVVDANDHG